MKKFIAVAVSVGFGLMTVGANIPGIWGAVLFVIGLVSLAAGGLVFAE
jgi:hypothetical protein